jgi:hypothetical protein
VKGELQISSLQNLHHAEGAMRRRRRRRRRRRKKKNKKICNT